MTREPARSASVTSALVPREELRRSAKKTAVVHAVAYPLLVAGTAGRMVATDLFLLIPAVAAVVGSHVWLWRALAALDDDTTPAQSRTVAKRATLALTAASILLLVAVCQPAARTIGVLLSGPGVAR